MIGWSLRRCLHSALFPLSVATNHLSIFWIQGITKGESGKDMESANLPVEMFLKDITTKVIAMIRENIHLQTDLFMRVTINMVRSMVKDVTDMPPVTFMPEAGRKVCKTVLESILMPMVKFIEVSTMQGNDMAKGNIFEQTAVQYFVVGGLTTIPFYALMILHLSR